MIILPSSFFSAGQAAEETAVLRVAVQEDIMTLNPLIGMEHHWTWFMTQWIYDTPVYSNYAGPVIYRWDSDDDLKYRNLMLPYIAIGTSNGTVNTGDWEACDIGNFSFLPEDDWANSEMPESIVYYDFENVRWHDGVQMDIDDILFSYHVAAQNPVWRSDIECLADQGDFDAGNFTETNWLNIDTFWESPDKLRAALKFTLQRPYGAFFHRTLAVLLLPYHQWGSPAFNQPSQGMNIWCDEGYEPGSNLAWNYSLAEEFEPTEPVGSGPLRWNSRNPGTNLTLDTWREHFFDDDYKYEKYCLDSHGKSLIGLPRIDGIVFQIKITNEKAVRDLRDGLVDFIGWSIPPTFVQDLANDAGIALQQSPEQGYYYAAYNMNRISFGYDENGTDRGRVLRRAIANCIDKNRLVQRLLLCFGIGGEGPVSSISSWFNDTIPRYSYDPDETLKILKDAGYQLTYPNKSAGYGNWWLNPDGTSIGSGEDGEIILISYRFTDFRCPQVNSMLVLGMQEVGLNVKEINCDYAGVLRNMQAGNFDMAATRTSIGSDPTEFLYKMFHSQGGGNYCGYNNASFDKIMDLARSSNDRDTAKKAIEDAQASIVYDLPIDVLYYRTNIETYRSDCFTGWVVGPSGSIFSKASIWGIRPPLKLTLNAQFSSPPSALVSNSTGTPISVLVRDQDGMPVEGAQVLLNASRGALADDEGYTNTAGRFTTSYTAPYVDPDDPDEAENGSKVIIQIKSATYFEDDAEYEPAPGRLTLITVYPEDVPFLSVSMSADPDIIDPDYSRDNDFGFTYVDVLVKNQNGDPVAGATVACEISPAIPDIEPPDAVTDFNGMTRFKITATDEPDDSGEIVEYMVTAYAEYENYKPGDNKITLQIVDAEPPEEPEPETAWTYYFTLPVALIGIFILMVVMLLYVRKAEK